MSSANHNGAGFVHRCLDGIALHQRQPCFRASNSTATDYLATRRIVCPAEAAVLTETTLGPTTAKADICLISAQGRVAAVECRYQESSGTAKEKLPYLVRKMIDYDADDRVLVYGGTKMADTVAVVQTIIADLNDRLASVARTIKVLTVDEFIDWYVTNFTSDYDTIFEMGGRQTTTAYLAFS